MVHNYVAGEAPGEPSDLSCRIRFSPKEKTKKHAHLMKFNQLQKSTKPSLYCIILNIYRRHLPLRFGFFFGFFCSFVCSGHLLYNPSPAPGPAEKKEKRGKPDNAGRKDKKQQVHTQTDTHTHTLTHPIRKGIITEKHEGVKSFFSVKRKDKELKEKTKPTTHLATTNQHNNQQHTHTQHDKEIWRD